MKIKKCDFMYRYNEYLESSGWDYDYDIPTGPPTVKIRLDKYEILSKTEKGVWIDWGGTKKFILLKAKKLYAWPTDQLAKESFIKRKIKQIEILKSQLNYAESALSKALDIFNFNNKEQNE